MDTSLFNLEEAQQHPLWAQELYNPNEHLPETEEYGITSFVYRARAPFDPKKVHSFFNQEWPGVIRTKGFFWLSTRPDFVGEVSQAGAFVRHQGIGRWWAAIPTNQWPEGLDFQKVMKQYWINDEQVFEKFGVYPNRVIDVQSLAGDSSDNIPGVPGIGIKTAAELINQYGDLEQLLTKASEIKQNKRRENLIEYADQARLSRSLVTLKKDVPVKTKIDQFKIQSVLDLSLIHI
mgnify:CR=1 FL=1